MHPCAFLLGSPAAQVSSSLQPSFSSLPMPQAPVHPLPTHGPRGGSGVSRGGGGIFSPDTKSHSHIPAWQWAVYDMRETEGKHSRSVKPSGKQDSNKVWGVLQTQGGTAALNTELFAVRKQQTLEALSTALTLPVTPQGPSRGPPR